MIAHLEFEIPRRAPSTDLDVLRLRLSDRNARVRKVGHAQKPLAQPGLNVGELMLQRGELVADSADLAHEWCGVLSPAFRGADLFRHRVALRLQLLGARLDRLALGFRLFELRGIEQVTTRLQPRRDAGQIVAQQLNIEHDAILPEALAHSMARARCADAIATRRLFSWGPLRRARAGPRAFPRSWLRG